MPKQKNDGFEDDLDIKTEGEFDDESMLLLEDVSGVEYLVDEELLVARRALSVQIKEDDKVQCENIFYA